MSEHRKYSVGEIDQMRENLQCICRDINVAENQLRTYMLNGTDPYELAYACFEAIQRRVERGRLNLQRLRYVTNNDQRWTA